MSFDIVLDALMRYAKSTTSPDELDRRIALAWLCEELQAKPEALLLRGFDRAYRLVVEGV